MGVEYYLVDWKRRRRLSVGKGTGWASPEHLTVSAPAILALCPQPDRARAIADWLGDGTAELVSEHMDDQPEHPAYGWPTEELDDLVPEAPPLRWRWVRGGEYNLVRSDGVHVGGVRRGEAGWLWWVGLWWVGVATGWLDDRDDAMRVVVAAATYTEGER